MRIDGNQRTVNGLKNPQQRNNVWFMILQTKRECTNNISAAHTNDDDDRNNYYDYYGQ